MSEKFLSGTKNCKQTTNKYRLTITGNDISHTFLKAYHRGYPLHRE